MNGRALATFRSGRTETWGQRFALAELYERNFVHLSTLLLHRSLLDTGIAFDDTLPLHEDWDFALQVAQHTRFADWPKPTFRWHADAGSSGGGGESNVDEVNFARHRDRIYAKWAPVRDAWVDRCAAALQRAAAHATRGPTGGGRRRCPRRACLQPERPSRAQPPRHDRHAERRTARKRCAPRRSQPRCGPVTQISVSILRGSFSRAAIASVARATLADGARIEPGARGRGHGVAHSCGASRGARCGICASRGIRGCDPATRTGRVAEKSGRPRRNALRSSIWNEAALRIRPTPSSGGECCSSTSNWVVPTIFRARAFRCLRKRECRALP